MTPHQAHDLTDASRNFFYHTLGDACEHDQSLDPNHRSCEKDLQ